MLTKYDAQLINSIPFFQIHPEYLPFIGDHYEQYKILIVGESHYIGQTPDNEEYSIEYFMKNWWNQETNSPGYEKWADWYNTRGVLNSYLFGDRHRGHLIFTNLVKAFSEKTLKKKIDSINIENSQAFHYLAFMNFFQMPSLFDGMKFWNSLVESGKKHNEPNLALSAWNKCSLESAWVLDSIIDILRPNLVIFSSKSAYYAYLESKTTHSNDNNIYCVPHAGSPYWNKGTKESNGKTGKELFFEFLDKLNT